VRAALLVVLLAPALARADEPPATVPVADAPPETVLVAPPAPVIIEPPPAPVPPPIVAPLPPLLPPVLVARPRTRSGRVYLKLQALAVYRYFFAESFGAANPELEVGGMTAAGGFSVGVRFGFMVGATRVGLPFEHPTFATVFTARLSERVRLGLGPQLGMMIVNRASHAPDDPISPTIGVFGELSVDFGKNLYVLGRVGYDWVAVNRYTDNGDMVTAQLGVGARF
jgi:hypothetical protein